jgi:hypothetical protein
MLSCCMPRAAFDDSREPDWDRLRELSTEVKTLRAAGRWDRAAFERVFAAGERAVNAHGEFLECIVNAAEPSWL